MSGDATQITGQITGQTLDQTTGQITGQSLDQSSGQPTGRDRALQALGLLTLDPTRLKGLTLRARAGPERDRVLAALPGPVIRLHPGMSAEALHGGIDLAQTLSEGHRVQRPGLAARKGWFVLSMAERCPPDLCALICQALDAGQLSPLIVLDEGAEADDHAPDALVERLAFHAQIDADCYTTPPRDRAPLQDQAGSARASVSPEDITTVTVLAARFGIDSLRAPLFALHAAQALASQSRNAEVSADDIAEAAALTFPHRATRLPEPPEDDSDPPPQEETPPPDTPNDTPDEPDNSPSPTDLPDSLLIEAVQAVLPPDMLALLQAGTGRSASAGSGAGQKRKGNRRGRPLPSRRKRLTGQDRIDLTATLRAAAPWQRLRRDLTPDKRLVIWPSDIHVKRYEDRSDRLLIFAVDASGSAALARLAEAKGAVELLLGEAYAARDHVALIAFRGEGADLLLPPTRSLVQTKRRLAALPGGGGTPLAAALKCVGETAQSASRHGLTPAIALLTDGRANIALDGQANRAKAQEDALQMARWLRAQSLPACVLDVGRRPHAALAELAGVLGASYVPLPRAEAETMRDVLKETLG